MGYRQVCPLIDQIADYASLSTKLPYPSQATLAQEIGVSERQVRRWTIALELLGILVVYRSRPIRERDGTYKRQTNRYLLCDRRAGHAPATCPLPRRHRKNPTNTQDSPTGHQCPLTPHGVESLGVVTKADGPPRAEFDQSVDVIHHETDQQAAPTPTADALAHIKSLRSRI